MRENERERRMKLNPKKILSMLLVVASIILVFSIAFSNNELENAWEALGNLKLQWVAGIFACWFIYMFFDALSYWFYLHKQGFRMSIGRSVNISLIGFYYSNITPSSAGGQPMQVNSMRKAGIPVGYGTMACTIRFICNQFVIVAVSLVLWIMNREFINQQLGGVIWVVRIGWLINFASVPLVIMAAFQRKLIQKIANGIIRFGKKIRIVKNEEAAIAVVTDVLDTYHTALRDLLHSPGQILLQILCAAISIFGLIGSILFVYHAFGLTGTPWYRLLTISFLLFVSASYTPLPGASGAQEGGFLVFYRGIFPSDLIGLALLVWRFFTYYLFLIIGAFTVVLEKIIVSREKKKNAQLTEQK